MARGRRPSACPTIRLMKTTAPVHRTLMALGALAGLLPGWAGAGTVSAASCTALNDAAERLACYDRLHGREGPGTGEAGAGGSAAVAAVPAVLPVQLPVPLPVPQAPAPGGGFLAERWDLERTRGELFEPRAYKPVYLLPATWTDRVNSQPSSPAPEHSVTEDLALRDIEAKYQISLKAKLAHRVLGTELSLWGGYTQSSRWQVYNGPISRPFRETNYEPELMVVAPLQGQWAGWRLRYGSLALNHQSNGRSLPLSRSWNRVVLTLGLERDDWVAELRPWFRINEGLRDDDNPDIANHIGRAELLLSRYREDHAFTLALRHSLRPGRHSRGSAQLDWVFPLTGALHGYLQVFSGYGESLVDYNLKQTKLGLGVTIAGWR